MGELKAKSKLLNKYSYEPVETLTTFQPFSISELIGQKICFVKKMEELYKAEMDRMKSNTNLPNLNEDNQRSEVKKTTKKGFFVS